MGRRTAPAPRTLTRRLSALDRRLLGLLQVALPLVPRPWAALGKSLGTTEDEVLRHVAALCARGLIREIGPVFDTQRLGYHSTLVAAQVAPQRLDAVARAVSRYPGVSHCYAREHVLNLWFTLAVPPGQDLDAELARLVAQRGVMAAHSLPVLRRYKLGVHLDMGTGEAQPAPRRPCDARRRRALTARDLALVRATQVELPLKARPFQALAAEARCTEAELLDWLAEMQALGYLRRFAAVLHHRQAGFRHNMLLAWRVPVRRIAAAGARAALFAEVSHCYRRPTRPGWPYNLLTMVHARTRSEGAAIAGRLARALSAFGVAEHAALRSVREFKKERVRYFAR